MEFLISSWCFSMASWCFSMSLTTGVSFPSTPSSPTDSLSKDKLWLLGGLGTLVGVVYRSWKNLALAIFWASLGSTGVLTVAGESVLSWSLTGEEASPLEVAVSWPASFLGDLSSLPISLDTDLRNLLLKLVLASCWATPSLGRVPVLVTSSPPFLTSSLTPSLKLAGSVWVLLNVSRSSPAAAASAPFCWGFPLFDCLAPILLCCQQYSLIQTPVTTEQSQDSHNVYRDKTSLTEPEKRLNYEFRVYSGWQHCK